MLFVVVQNTGTTTWPARGPYQLQCTAGCPFHPAGGVPTTDVLPGQQVSLYLDLPFVGDPLPVTYVEHVRMEDFFTPFGQDIVVTATVSQVAPLLHEPAPTCSDPAGIAWTFVNIAGGNTRICGLSGLQLQQASSSIPEVNATTVPGLDPSTYIAKVHVHLTASTTTFAGLAFHTAARCGGRRLEVRSGFMRVIEYDQFVGQTICSMTVVAQTALIPLADYDLLYESGPGRDAWYINGGLLFSGGYINTTGDGPPGLEVEDAGGVSAPVVFSEFEIDHLVRVNTQVQLQ